VLLAGLKPLERHRHSRTVPYVIPGRDATVAYGVRDFRFENINSSPICILTDVKGCRLTIDIYGAADDRKIVKVFTSRPRYSGVAGRKTVIDPTLPPGTRKITDKGARGVSAVVYRTITNADGEAVTGVVSRDRYPGQAVVVAVGPKVKTEIVAEPAVSRTDTPIVDNTKVKSD
jgi:vancomycin resistance protein YoaR